MTAVDAGRVVTPLGSNGYHEPDEPEAAPRRDSPLGSLKARRARQQEALYLDLLVPGWHEQPGDPNPISIYVRCKPAGNTDVAAATEKRRKNRKQAPNWIELANADTLIKCCIGIYALEGQPASDLATDEREKMSLRDGDPHGDWTRFDQDLAATLGVPEPAKAVDVVFELFPTQAQVVKAVSELARWSGIEAPKDQEDFFGD